GPKWFVARCPERRNNGAGRGAQWQGLPRPRDGGKGALPPKHGGVVVGGDIACPRRRYGLNQDAALVIDDHFGQVAKEAHLKRLAGAVQGAEWVGGGVNGGDFDATCFGCACNPAGRQYANQRQG